MNEKTLEALKASIAKWERNLQVSEKALKNGEYVTDDDEVSDKTGASLILTTMNECPLCGLFFSLDCGSCPVKRRTGRNRCWGTPYIAVTNIFGSALTVMSTPELVDAVRQEVAFLKDLLPKDGDACSSTSS